MSKKYNVILFDLDGTAIDSDPMIIQTFYDLYDKYNHGIRRSDKEILKFSGPLIRDTLKNEFPNLEINAIFDEFIETSKKYYSSHTFLYKDEKEVLTELKKLGYKLGVVTNKSHIMSEYVLRIHHLETLFDIIIGFDDVTQAKPHQEGMLKAIKYFNETDLGKVLYVGDNLTDYLSAKNAGIDSCLVNWEPIRYPSDTPCTFKINSYLDLKEKLNG